VTFTTNVEFNEAFEIYKQPSKWTDALYGKTSMQGHEGVPVLKIGKAGGDNGAYGAFTCCGARVASNLSGVFGSASRIPIYKKVSYEIESYVEPPNKQELWEMKASLAAAILNRSHSTHQLYMIASTAQMNSFKNSKYHVLNFLLELGAEEIDARPNRYHTPNKLHMLVLCYEDQKAKWDKYVRYAGGNIWVQRPFPGSETKKPEAPKVEPATSVAWPNGDQFFMDPSQVAAHAAQPMANRPQYPARDEFGRFVTKTVK
jgi:hypothetical protein